MDRQSYGVGNGGGGQVPDERLGEPIGVDAPPGSPIRPAEALPVPEGRAISPLFNIGGAPIAVLGGVFSGGLPIGGPVTQIFRGGSAPTPPTLFIATITPSGPIGGFLIGESGAPIGVQTFGGGGLPVGLPPVAGREASVLQPRTTLVGAGTPLIGLTTPPVLVFGQAQADEGAQPGGASAGGVGSGGAPIGG